MRASGRLVLCLSAPILLMPRPSSAAGASTVAPPDSGTVYTADEGGRSISVIHLDTGWVDHVATRISPHRSSTWRSGR